MRRPVGREWPPCCGAEGIEPERYGAVGRACAGPLDQPREAERLTCAVGAEVEFEAKAGVESNGLEGRVQSRRIGLLQSKAVRPDRAGENDRKTVRAAREIVERLGVGLAPVGVVELGHHTPRS